MWTSLFTEEILEAHHQSIHEISNCNENVNEFFAFEEVSKAIDKAKSHKAYLEIPNEAIKNINAKLLFHNFFQLCFSSGLNPSDWDKSHIKPIPKKDNDLRE